MKTTSVLLAALAAAPCTFAHTVWTTFYVDGVSQGDGVAMRMRKDPAKASFPLEDLSSNDMACNVDGETGVSRVQSVPDGATLSFEIRSWPNDPTKERLDRGHKGPCAVYLKKVDSAVEDKGYGDGWFKLFDDGYDASTDQWCSDRVIDNNGILSVVLPKGLQGGYYLARPELLALHNANAGDPQFYAGCAQIFIDSTGSLAPMETVSIPGYVKAGEPSVSFNIYTTDNSEYTMPGPKVATLSASAGVASDAQTSQTEGLKPGNCECENANWCGVEVPSYSDEAGCWASGENCWKQLDTCYDTAPPTGSAGCELWQAKCQAINDACNAGNFNGPPNKGKTLTPKPSTIDVGPVMHTSGGGVDNSAPKTSAAAAPSSATPKPKSNTPVAAAPSQYTSAAAPPKSSVAAAPKPSSAAAPKPATTSAGSLYGWYAEGADASASAAQTRKHTTITIPASEDAPAPTKASCPEGWHCVTEYATHVVTEVVYVTVEPDAYAKRGMRYRRHGRRS